ncbi:diguanylate cyclase (GGDEF)-like protein/PAS domain S-box-containing protein [Paenibacillus endophyticus]|uniref:Diguanylate cyclase (GGDEF)-like protein/PAS domain S-box-containing protein n=1 Tax=Paenibacillus endophyticus TaxID=1294268 RepID=A0A7W5GC08_9BACL|nr:EAL domain-containing protein [Paenibacillus endophyticus]MBB3154360.1 diguanylate cyclase (GGDEF)-like protein/PAS domain S-box-containing protein [Paenibacillus endophyticus]
MEHVHGSYDSLLVLFSYIIAVMASYTALDLAGRVSTSKGTTRLRWLTFGAASMGMGIWSMHFVGMLALNLPIAIEYDLVIVLLSVFAAIGAAFIALFVVGRSELTGIQLLIGGILLAIGISVMHYVGMAAMLIPITYNPLIFILSVLIAFGASIAALWLSFYFRKGNRKGEFYKKLGSGAIMGAAISGMHYTGMTAANFHNSSKSALFYGVTLDHKWLAYFIAGGIFFTLGLSLFGIYIAKRLARKDSEIEQNEKWYKSLYENSQDGIVSVDLQRNVISHNPIALQITGFSSKEVMNQSISTLKDIIVSEDQERVRQMFQRCFDGETLNHETSIIRHDGMRVELSVSNVPVVVDGIVVGIYIIFKDITQEKQAKLRINHLAFHDELTGLPNRRMFNQAISEAITANSSTREPFVVMVLDIDRFKIINDSLGHTVGDQFLQEVSKRIQLAAMESSAMLARMGGDEFTLLCSRYSELAEIEQLAQDIIIAIQAPYRLKESDFYVSASIGISIFPMHGQDAGQLLRNADTAMYEVKKKGKNDFLFFSNELDEQLLEKIELESDLRKAIERGELLLHYQPQIRTEDHAMIGIEALVRWEHPTKGLLSPGLFIPIAEETGLIYEMGTWVLREACQQMRRWHDEGGPLIPISVNLSSQQFHQPKLAEYIMAILEQTGLKPEFLELEITESMMMDASLSSSILNQLNEYGIRISLDDFGTGYSSLSYLKMFPIHKVKIDRSFIRDITENNNDRAIVSTIIAMAQHLNMEVIAEGIETKDQLDILTDNSCQKIQGYYFSKPLPALDVEQAFFVPERKEATNSTK